MALPLHIPSTEPVPPPSYQTLHRNRTATVTPIIVDLQQVLPGKPVGPNIMLAGPPLKHQADLMSFSASISYGEVIKLLHQRVLARSGLRVPSKSNLFYCRAVLVVDGREILLEKGSWTAAKDVLDMWEDAELIFLFAVVPRGYRGVGFRERLRRLFWGLRGGSVCLVEPDFGMPGICGRLWSER